MRLHQGDTLPEPPLGAHNGGMERSGFQLSVAGLLGLVACIALNIWLFRFGALWGIIGLNISKHVLIAYLCQVLGVDKRGKAVAPPVVLPPCAPPRPLIALGTDER